MASTFSYRPKKYSVDELKAIAEKRNTNLNRLIEESLLEKFSLENGAHEGSSAALARKITRIVVEHMGVRLVEPDGATKAKILKKARENDAKGTWISDDTARPHVKNGRLKAPRH